MKRKLGTFFSLALFIIIAIIFLIRLKGNKPVFENQNTLAMKITSSAFQDRGFIPSKYTCDGENINPPLSFSEIPDKTESLVLIVDDPDAPGGNFTHWLVWNLNPRFGGIEEGKVPEKASEGTNDFSKAGYGGPCPPSGTHRYQFSLYALDTKLELNPEIKKSDLENAMRGHILAQALLVGLYKR